MRTFFRPFSKLVSATEKCLNFAGVWLIIALILSVVADIAYRNVFGRSIAGVLELDELFLVGIVFLGVAYTQSLKGHIGMELLTNRLKGKI